MTNMVHMRAVVGEDGDGNRTYAEAKTTYVSRVVAQARAGSIHEFGVFTGQGKELAVVPCSTALPLSTIMHIVDDVLAKEGI